MRITKKQVELLANLINECTVYTMLVKDALAEEGYNPKIREYMQSHDEAAVKLNTMLGTTAVGLYIRKYA